MKMKKPVKAGCAILIMGLIAFFQNCGSGQFRTVGSESASLSRTSNLSSNPPVTPTPVPNPAPNPTPSPSPSPLPVPLPQPSPGAIGPAGQDANLYSLNFQDEFDNGTSFDTSKWSTDIWYKPNNPTKNYNVSGGNLNIWPKLDGSMNFFDRTIVGENKFLQLYGFFEIEAKLPVGAGLHPVVSLTNNQGLEIAIMHAYTGAPNGGWSTADLHSKDYVVTACLSPDNYLVDSRARDHMSVPDLSASFHKYGVRWDATTIKYYFDGLQVGPTYQHMGIRAPMYFYIGLWMVNEETSPSVSQTPQGLNNSFQINYVRAWKLK
jgi:beta-glucanase (GH16 family)